MGLIIHKGANGSIRPTWWGRVIYKGKAHETNLGVPIRGKIPMDADGKIALSSKRDGKAGLVDLIERTRVTRRIGKYAASIWGWHNLRHNFVTVALNSGVPPHKVAAITGHSSVAMTLAYADMQTKTGKRSTAKVLPEKPSTDAFIASLSASERKDLARKLPGL